MKYLFSFLVLSLLALSATARGDDTNEWRLLGEAQVDGQGIYLDQVIAPAPATAFTNAAIPHIRLAAAPSPGQAASLSRKQIAELAKLQGAEIESSNWLGANQVRVSRRMRSFAEFEMMQMLTALLQKGYVKDRGELELRLARPVSLASVPDEPLTLKVVEMPSSGVLPVFIAKMELWTASERVAEWQANLQASVWREVATARTPVARGTLLKEGDFEMERRDVLLRRDYYLNYPTQDDMLELTDTIQPGMPLLNHCVRNRPVIQRGRVVEGVYRDGALSISLRVETLEDGALGQMVRVRNPKTRHELYGKIQNEQTILISL